MGKALVKNSRRLYRKILFLKDIYKHSKKFTSLNWTVSPSYENSSKKLLFSSLFYHEYSISLMKCNSSQRSFLKMILLILDIVVYKAYDHHLGF